MISSKNSSFNQKVDRGPLFGALFHQELEQIDLWLNNQISQLVFILLFRSIPPRINKLIWLISLLKVTKYQAILIHSVLPVRVYPPLQCHSWLGYSSTELFIIIITVTRTILCTIGKWRHKICICTFKNKRQSLVT